MQDSTPNIAHPLVASPTLPCLESAKFENHDGFKLKQC